MSIAQSLCVKQYLDSQSLIILCIKQYLDSQSLIILCVKQYLDSQSLISQNTWAGYQSVLNIDIILQFGSKLKL